MNYRGYDFLRGVIGFLAFIAAIAYFVAAGVHTYLWWSSYIGTNVTSEQLLRALFNAEFIFALVYALANAVAAIYFLRYGCRKSLLSEGIWIGGLVGAMTPLILILIDFVRVAITSFGLLSDGEYGMVVYVVMLGLAMLTFPSGILVGAVIGAVVQRSKRAQK